MSPQVYIGRLGQRVTDPEAVEARRVQQQMRRLITIGAKAGRPWNRAATAGQLARATKLSPARVVEIIRGFEWHWGLTETGAIENWWVWGDGE